MGLVHLTSGWNMSEQTVSGNIYFQPEKGAADGGRYFVANPVTGHGVQIVTRHVSPEDLRAMAAHLEAQRNQSGQQAG